MSLDPEATSTPTIVPRIQGRKTIRPEERDSDSIQSPITPDSVKHFYETRSRSRSYEISGSPTKAKNSRRRKDVSPNRSDSSDCDGTDEEIYEENKLFKPHTYALHKETDNYVKDSENNMWKKYTLLACIVGITGLIICFASGHNVEPRIKLPDICDSLHKLLKTQDADFCLNINVTLEEIANLNQPKTVMFLYEHDSEPTLNKIINSIIKYSLCYLSDCSNSPVVLEGLSLKKSKYENDYGKIIAENRDSLSESKVMLVRNLEKVAGESAQAFHSFCDDYNPVVQGALIIFTMEVDELPHVQPQIFVRQTLLKLWSDIGKDDKFDPLITRIGGTVLPIKSD